MKKFNELISIEVQVDSIAHNLLSNMKEDFKHKELVTEHLIGRMLAQDKNGLSHLFNSLNGFTGEINFKIGDKIIPEELSCYAYWDDDKTKASTKYIKSATIIEIDKYADMTLKVEYEKPMQDGTNRLETSWVHHSKCKDWASVNL